MSTFPFSPNDRDRSWSFIALSQHRISNKRKTCTNKTPFDRIKTPPALRNKIISRITNYYNWNLHENDDEETASRECRGYSIHKVSISFTSRSSNRNTRLLTNDTYLQSSEEDRHKSYYSYTSSDASRQIYNFEEDIDSHTSTHTYNIQ